MKTRRILGSCLILAFLAACQIVSATPTGAPAPFSDEVLVSFSIDASDGMDEVSACLAARDIYRFVLYEDGRLVKYDGFQYLETTISRAEIDDLLVEIEATGFSSLRGDGDQYTENAPPPSFLAYPWGGSVTVDGKTIPITPGRSADLAAPVTKTLEILDSYQPANLQPYAPERVRLWAFPEGSIDLGLANPTPEPAILEWPADQIDLDELHSDPATSGPQFISGEASSFLLGQVEHLPVVRRLQQDGQNYLVVICPHFAQ